MLIGLPLLKLLDFLDHLRLTCVLLKLFSVRSVFDQTEVLDQIQRCRSEAVKFILLHLFRKDPSKVEIFTELYNPHPVLF